MIRHYWPILAMALIIWVTVIWARTVPGNPITLQRLVAIFIAAGCWYTIGTVIERIKCNREKRKG